MTHQPLAFSFHPQGAERLILTEGNFQHLTAEDFYNIEKKRPISFALNGAKAQGWGKSNHKINFQAELMLCRENKTYALIEQGWQLPILLPRNQILILDRNISSEFTARFEFGSLKGSATDDLLNFFDTQDHSYTSFLSVIEGHRRPGEVQGDIGFRLKNSNQSIRKSIGYNNNRDEILDAGKLLSIESIFDVTPTESEISFMIWLCDYVLCKKTSEKRKISTLLEVLDMAKECKVRGGMTIMASVMPLKLNDGCYAEKIIKPKDADRTKSEITKKQYAYNSLSDLRKLEIFQHFLPRPGQDKSFSLLTKDRGMVGFWSSISPRFKWSDGSNCQYAYRFDDRHFCKESMDALQEFLSAQ